MLLLLDLIFKKEIDDMPDDKFPKYIGKNKIIKIQKYHNYGLPYGMFENNKLFTMFLPLLLTIVLFFKWCMLTIGSFENLFALLKKVLYLLSNQKRKYKLAKKEFKVKGNFFKRLALSFVILGSASNLIDRFTRGYVVDYFSFNKFVPKRIKETVFNIGDICILIGVVIGTIFSFIKKEN